MRMSDRDYEAARIALHCPETATPGRSLSLEDAMIAADRWARWAEDGHVMIGDLQAGPCCDPPAVSSL
jgi:hypothetical protein